MFKTCFLIGWVFSLALSSAGAATLKVMSYNILLGGDHWYSLELTVNLLQRVDADVVGIQEADANGPELARRLGYHWYPVEKGTRRGGVLSRYPISKHYRQGVEVAIPGGEKIHLFSVHLRSDPYEPYDIQSGKLTTERTVIESAKKSRGAEISEVIAEMAPIIAAGEPLFLVGDFNEPSHLDWTSAAGPTGAGLHLMAVHWPTSVAVADAGLSDAYRTVYPDPVLRKGYTWTPLISPGEIHDRIDRVYFAGQGIKASSVGIVGEKDGPEVDIVGHHPYPSDHRGVLANFHW